VPLRTVPEQARTMRWPLLPSDPHKAVGDGGLTAQVQEFRMRRIIARLLICGLSALLLALGAVWSHVGSRGIYVLLRNGGIYWIAVKPDDPRLSPSVRLALGVPPTANPGGFEWRMIKSGFAVGELAAIAGDREVDRIFLARIDPARFRFEVRSAPAGDRNLDAWMARLRAALIINGSYYSRRGAPDIPILSAGTLMGPKTYDAKAGAFVASAGFVGIRDLAQLSWQGAFKGALDAMVSYPLLLAENGTAAWSRANGS
jgi:hypothetical protein